jgi:hypothetical protein
MLMDETIALNSHIKWTVYYEEEFTQNPSVEKLRSDLNYLKKVSVCLCSEFSSLRHSVIIF